ncbi:unnamed protein product [Aphis gossypii]|uniref:Apyrase n=1 Tax=Aphis gossypii TaxID=80765 RepID=A0A9P0N8M8_APHGO|nr:unnamed protein product [Aphis gossypii]
MICFTVIYYQITLLYQQIVVEVNADSSEQQSNSKNNLYCAVAIDAGSTGTRILAVAFEKIQFIKKKTLLQRIFCYKGFTKECIYFKIDNYIFQKEEGGLSQYAYNEMKREQIIRALLKQAENFMNTNQKCGITPLLLRATAGLRLLNDKSDEIINQVKRIFSEYSNKFKVDENSVAIMNGDDEGYYAWFTINYLFDNQMSFKNTAAVFDLGGGSLQITFYLPNNEKNITIDPKYIKLYTVMGEERKFYTYSYLGFGLMEVRTKIFKPKDNDILNVTSPCHNTNDVLTYTFNSKIYYITGSLSDGIKENYKTCQKAIKSIVEKTVGNLEDMTSLNYTVAISFFYDLGLDAELIRTFKFNIIL